MPQFQNDLVPGVMAGANIVNQAWQRQERMMELRAQAAQQAMREREIAAQASYLTQNAAQIKAQVDQQQQDQIDLQAVNDLFHQQTEIGGKDPRTAMLNVLPAAALKNPRVGKHLADTLAEMDKSAEVGQPKPMDPLVAQKMQAETELTKARTQKIVSGEGENFSPDVTEKQALALQKASDAVDEAYMNGDEQAIQRAEKYHADLKDAQARQHPDRQAQVELGLLNTELRAALKNYYDNQQDPKLKPDIDRLKTEIRNFGKTGKSVSQEPLSTEAQPAARFRLDPKTGKLVPSR